MISFVVSILLALSAFYYADILKYINRQVESPTKQEKIVKDTAPKKVTNKDFNLRYRGEAFGTMGAAIYVTEEQ